MKSMSRRRYLGISAAALLGSSARGRTEGAEEIAVFMEKFSVPGLSFAIAKDGKLVRRGAFGLAKLEGEQALNSAHRFRIASVSKPITAAAIFLLKERGKLGLGDPVFGKGGLLGRPGPEGCDGAAPVDPHLRGVEERL